MPDYEEIASEYMDDYTKIRARNSDGFTVVADDTTYKFVEPFAINVGTDDEAKAFKKALSNYMEGKIKLETLHMIAKNPSWYDQHGILIPAVPAAEGIDILNRYIPKGFRETHHGLPMIDEPLRFKEFPKRTIDEIVEETRVNVEKEARVRLAKKLFDAGVKPVNDKINYPAHYTHYKGVEVIDITEKLNFNRGNAVKYIARAGFKNEGTEVQDLQKALWYVEREMGNSGNDATLPILKFEEVDVLVGQMNYFRGTAVWQISLAGRLRETIVSDLNEAKHAIMSEIKRLGQYEEEL